MFEEPVGIGLIRFADAYDHWRTEQQEETDDGGEEEEGGGQEERAPGQLREFDLSHQPLLVIYTRRPK